MAAATFATVDEYIASFPDDVQVILEKVRAAIHSGIPDGDEKIRYSLAAVMLGGRYALHFGGWKRHVGIYPVPEAPEELEKAIAPYRGTDHALAFKYAEPIPYDLIERVARFVYELRAGE